MKVKELIDKLETLDPELEVILTSEYGCHEEYLTEVNDDSVHVFLEGE